MTTHEKALEAAIHVALAHAREQGADSSTDYGDSEQILRAAIPAYLSTLLSEDAREVVLELQTDEPGMTQAIRDRAATLITAQAAEIARLREAERAAHSNFLDAWQALPEGYHSPSAIDRWLRETMKPAVDRARSTTGGEHD